MSDQSELLSMAGIGQGTNMPRPTEKDPEIRAAAVELLLEQVVEWFYDDEEVAGDEAEVRDDLLEATEHNIDGYDIAKYLDMRCHWSVDARLVEIVDDYAYCLSKATDLAVLGWVKCTTPICPYSLGQDVRFKGVPAVITAIDDEQARITVCVPSEGHVRQGIGILGHVLPWESKLLH